MKERAKKLIELQVSNNSKLLHFVDNELLPIVRKFDGKVFNARFKNAIKKQIENRKIFQWIKVTSEYGMFTITLQPWQRCVDDCTGCEYLHNSELTVAYLQNFKGDNPALKSENRLQAENIINSIIENCKRLESNNSKMLKSLRDYPSLKVKKDKLLKQIEDFNNSVCAESDSYLKLRIDVRR